MKLDRREFVGGAIALAVLLAAGAREIRRSPGDRPCCLPMPGLACSATNLWAPALTTNPPAAGAQLTHPAR
jgi:hypothetical protein